MIQDTGCETRDKRDHESCVMNCAGFSLIELMITVVVFILVIAAASQVFTGLLTQFKQQGKIAETNIEGIVGLDILRRDIEQAGYGLLWNSNWVYDEATDTTYNECGGVVSCSEPPGAILSGDDGGFNNSDYLVIRATNVATNKASQAWTLLGAGDTKIDGLSGESLSSTDRVIVISPGGTTDLRALMSNGTTWKTTYGATSAFAPPAGSKSTYIVYGVDSNSDLRMPFNRADYYINTAAGSVPGRCAPGTGVLTKGVINNSTGAGGGTITGSLAYPLLDCVADVEVIYGLDQNQSGTISCYTNDLSNLNGGLSAANVRNQVKEVRVYILAHEGQIDRTFTFNTNPVVVGEPNVTGGGVLASCEGANKAGEDVLGRSFDFFARGVTDWQNYRWKVYTIVVKPKDLL